MCKGTINKIIPFSSVDGPGNRMVLFLQGCNYNCLYCHNPETINNCFDCGKCISECRVNALRLIDSKVIWDKDKCINCDLCIKKCKNQSSPKTIKMSTNEIIEEVKKYKSFISGITISDGECTLQHEFITDIFYKVKKLNLTTFIDTNGSTPIYEYKNLLNVTDGVMLDIKSFDNDEHKMLTGKDNEIVIKNAKFLSKLNKLYEIRTVIVPNLLDNHRNVDNISKIIVSINPNIRYKIIKYRNLGVRTNLIDSHTPSDDTIKELVDICIRNGCKNIISV